MKSIKLLVINPKGEQELTEIDVSGKYYDDSKVIWDERINGQFPPEMIAKVGGLSLVGKNLVVDQAKVDAHVAKKEAEAAKKDALKSAKEDAIAAIKAVDLSKPIDAEQVGEIVKHLVALSYPSTGG